MRSVVGFDWNALGRLDDAVVWSKFADPREDGRGVADEAGEWKEADKLCLALVAVFSHPIQIIGFGQTWAESQQIDPKANFKPVEQRKSCVAFRRR